MISVGIPACNAEKYLARTLESVLAQTLTDWECVLVNDGSTDRTLAIAREYAARDSRFCVVEQPNGGLAAARDTCFANMNRAAEAVIFLDADDVWEPDALKTLLTALQAHPQAVGAHGIARYIDGEGKHDPPDVLEAWCRARPRIASRHAEKSPPDTPTNFDTLAYWTCMPTPGVLLIRRNAMEKTGAWDREPPGGCEDWDMELRLCRFGDFVYVDQILLNYRQHGGNMSGNAKRMRQAEFNLRRKVMRSPEFTPEQKAKMALAFRLCERDKCRAKLAGARQDMARFRVKKAAFETARAFRNYLYFLRGLPDA